MAVVRGWFLLSTGLLAAMFALNRLFLESLKRSDFYFTLLLLVYFPFLNFSVLKTAGDSTSFATPAPSKRILRLMFPCTFFASLLVPTVVLVIWPQLANTGLLRHLWLVLAQLLLESAAFVASNQIRVSVLVRITLAATCISYRLTVAKEWWYLSANPIQGVPYQAVNLGRILAAFNLLYWGLLLFGYLFLVCIPYHTNEYFSVKPKRRRSSRTGQAEK